MKYKSAINPEFKRLASYVNSLHEEPEDTKNVIYAERNLIYTDCVEGVDVTVKSFHKPSLFNRIIYTYFRKSKARRSYENAVKLIKLDVGTPFPIGFKEIYHHGLLENSYYVCRYLPNCCDLRLWENKPNCDEVLEHAAEFLGQLHCKGVWHKDFSPGNVLYDNNWNFYVIDINRMKFGVFDRKRLMQNFKSIHLDDDVEETMRFAIKYVKYSPFKSRGEDNIVDWALEARQGYMRKRAMKRAFKKIFKFRR